MVDGEGQTLRVCGWVVVPFDIDGVVVVDMAGGRTGGRIATLPPQVRTPQDKLAVQTRAILFDYFAVTGKCGYAPYSAASFSK